MVIGLGSGGDVPIDYLDPVTGLRMSGAYRSSFDEASLAAIARTAGGSYRSIKEARELEYLLDDTGALLPPVASPVSHGQQIRPAPGVPLGRPLFIAAMVCAAVAWLLRRLVLGGLA